MAWKSKASLLGEMIVDKCSIYDGEADRMSRDMGAIDTVRHAVWMVRNREFVGRGNIEECGMACSLDPGLQLRFQSTEESERGLSTSGWHGPPG